MSELVPVIADRVEVLADDSLVVRAAAVAGRPSSPATRRTYASVYRALCVWLGEDAGVDEFDVAVVQAWRDELEARGAAPATVAKHLSALRYLAAAIGSDPAIRDVKAQRVATGQPRSLTHAQLERLLRMPDARTRQGKRDLAILQLLAGAGLRRSELCSLELRDVDERRRAGDGAVRRAVSESTAWWVTVRYAKRGSTRQIPLPRPTLDAIAAWVKARPTTGHELLFCSLPRTGRPPGKLSTRDVARTVARHAHAAGLPDDRRSPHVLRHTYCTLLAGAGAAVEVIRELAGHADIRTTMIYTAFDADRLEQTVTDAHSHRAKLAALSA